MLAEDFFSFFPCPLPVLLALTCGEGCHSCKQIKVTFCDGTLLGFCRLRVVSSLPLVYSTWKLQIGDLVLYFIDSIKNSFAAVLEYVRPGKLPLKNGSDPRLPFAQ